MLRDEHRRVTRARIVEAVAALVAEAHPAAISVPAVAARAEVSVATVYRYFPTKEALLDASMLVMGPEAAIGRIADLPRTFEEVAERLPASFADVAAHLTLARNQLASPLGRELRRRRWEAKVEVLRSALSARGIDPDSVAGQRLAALVDLLTSSTVVLEMHDKAGIPVEDASSHVLWALAALERATHEDASPEEETRP